MKLWLDDIRAPWKFGCIGWTWVKTADEAIELLKTGKVEMASLDHDLQPLHYEQLGYGENLLFSQEETGYKVALFYATTQSYSQSTA